MGWTTVVLWLVVVVVLTVRFWPQILRMLIGLMSLFTDKVRLQKDAVEVKIALVTTRLDAVLTLQLSEPRLRLIGLHFPVIRAELDIIALKRKESVSEVLEEVKKNSKLRYLKLFPLEFIVDTVELVISFRNPPRDPSPADSTGGYAWSSTLKLSHVVVRSRRGGFSASLANVTGACEVDNMTGKWLSVENANITQSSSDLRVAVTSVNLTASVEAYFKIFPTLAPLIEVSQSAAVPATLRSPQLPWTVKLDLQETLSLQLSVERVGTCRLEIPKIFGSISKNLQIQIKAGGCIMTRSSVDHGDCEMVRLPAFTVSGTAALIDVDVPNADLATCPDGLVFWIRAVLMCANKFSFIKRPWRIGVRNSRTWAYYDHELCGVSPADWGSVPQYIPKIVPVRIRLNFLSSLTLRTDAGGERVVTEAAVIDCNLPEREIAFSAVNVQLFGVSGRKCAFIQKFSGWVPQFSSVVLRDSDEVLAAMGSPPDEVRCHHARPSALGPIPVSICFSTVSVDFADDLVALIGRQVMQAVENIRRWTIDVGYDVVPFYKPVTIRLSNVRFAPKELAPAVLDVRDWELAIGPTKDCLSFAFLGVKAWVPTTPVIAPIVCVPDPVLVTLRVKRLVPVRRVAQASDFALLPGCWRELSIQAPLVKGAIVPGLHATTRFVKSVLDTVKRTFVSTDVPLYKKGPIKTVAVESGGGEFLVVRATEKSKSRMATEDMDERTVRAETLAHLRFGRLSLSMENFQRTVFGKLAYLRVHVRDLLVVELGATAVQSDDRIYAITVSNDAPVTVRVKDNGMALFTTYSALRDCVSRAWTIDPMPKLNSMMTHIVDINETARAISSPRMSLDSLPEPTVRSPVLSARFAFDCPQGFVLNWTVPGGGAGLEILIPGSEKNLSGEIVFHGFALLGDDVYRRLPDVADQVLVQWLRYPWTCTAETELQPSVQSERASWDLHAIMTMRISEYLASAGRDGSWAYASARGFLDTPMYCQVQLEVANVTVSVGGAKMASTERLEVRGHAHNLPTVPGKPGTRQTPKLKMSYWTAMEQSRREPSLILNPIVQVPILLTLLGSPADADSSLAERASDDSDETQSVHSVSGKSSLLDKFLDRVDLGFRITISNTCGRAAGWAFAASRICVFKEEDRGKGLIVTEIRDGQVALEISGSLAESMQPLHTQVCLSAPRADTPAEVCPLVSVRQMMVHVGLRQADGSSGTTVFCNIQGVKMWWSPALSRGMRLSLGRTDGLVQMVTRWKQRFTQELYVRLGKSRRKKKTLESILKLLDFFIPSGGSLRLVVRCADVQLSFHNLLHGVEDLFPAPSGVSQKRSSLSGSKLITSPEIPKHFQPFNSTPVMSSVSLPTAPPIRMQCSCCSPSSVNRDSPALRKNGLDLAEPKFSSWWTRAGHFQNCPLPPMPLALFFAPPTARRERAVGGVEFEKWLDECHGAEQMASPSALKPKPRGSQMLLVATESVIDVNLQRVRGVSNLRVSANAAFKNIHGSVAPTALRGIVWLGKSGQSILRQILQIPKIVCVVSADLFAFHTAKVRLLVPKVVLSTDDDAFQTLTDVFRNCLLYRGQLIDPNKSAAAAASSFLSPPASPNPKSGPSSATRFDGFVPASKREGIIEGLLTSLAVADATLEAATESVSVEYIVEHISVSLTHRQRCFVQLLLTQVVGKQALSLNHPHRPMHFSFQVGDVSMIAADGGGDRTVLRSAAPTGAASAGNLVTIRGNDRYITLNNREWQVYDSLFVSTSPLVVDITQDLIDEMYSFVFPPGDGSAAASSLALADEQVEVAGNKLLTGRNKARAKPEMVRKDTVGELIPAGTQKSSGSLVFFKFVRFGNIDCIVTFKGKQFSLNHMAVTIKYYLRRRRLATWKEFLDEWATKVGKQAVGSFVKHGFTRKRGIQDIIVTKFSSASNDVDKLLFGKFA